jgi:hypothetical protein
MKLCNQNIQNNFHNIGNIVLSHSGNMPFSIIYNIVYIGTFDIIHNNIKMSILSYSVFLYNSLQQYKNNLSAL